MNFKLDRFFFLLFLLLYAQVMLIQLIPSYWIPIVMTALSLFSMFSSYLCFCRIACVTITKLIFDTDQKKEIKKKKTKNNNGNEIRCCYENETWYNIFNNAKKKLSCNFNKYVKWRRTKANEWNKSPSWILCLRLVTDFYTKCLHFQSIIDFDFFQLWKSIMFVPV